MTIGKQNIKQVNPTLKAAGWTLAADDIFCDILIL